MAGFCPEISRMLPLYLNWGQDRQPDAWHRKPYLMLYTQAIHQKPRSIAMATSTVFINNRTQAVRLPAELRLPDDVKRVDVRARGNERIIAPLGQTWDSFFLGGQAASEDFMSERASQEQMEREAL
jgi:antitoxin VapB